LDLSRSERGLALYLDRHLLRPLLQDAGPLKLIEELIVGLRSVDDPRQSAGIG
jgi:hypothetical protein